MDKKNAGKYILALVGGLIGGWIISRTIGKKLKDDRVKHIDALSLKIMSEMGPIQSLQKEQDKISKIDQVIHRLIVSKELQKQGIDEEMICLAVFQVADSLGIQVETECEKYQLEKGGGNNNSQLQQRYPYGYGKFSRTWGRPYRWWWSRRLYPYYYQYYYNPYYTYYW